jgi:hypothetical protein
VGCELRKGGGGGARVCFLFFSPSVAGRCEEARAVRTAMIHRGGEGEIRFERNEVARASLHSHREELE